MPPCSTSANFTRILTHCLGSHQIYSQMVLQKSSVGELPFYYGGPSNRPAVIVLQVTLIAAANIIKPFKQRSCLEHPCYMNMTLA